MSAKNNQLIRLMHGDCIERMRAMVENSVGQIVTDPPYLIDFMNKKWDSADVVLQVETVLQDETEEESKVLSVEELHQHDAWHQAWLREAFRVLIPGKRIKVFSATRTFHRLAAAMEFVGFVLDPDALEAWGQGQGFPKSLNISKSIDAQLLHAGSDSTRIKAANEGRPGDGRFRASSNNNGILGEISLEGRMIKDTASTPDAQQFAGFGTALKPGWEPFIVGRKPALI